jgi:hypothetical protein
LFAVSTQVPPQSVGVAAGQPETHVDPAHTGVPPLHAKDAPQPPQLLLLVAKSTHAPLQALNPLLQVKVHAPETHAAVALETPVVQACPQMLQLSTSVAGSTQLPPQSVGAAGGQPEAHEYASPDPTHAGVPPVHALPQLPQLADVVSWTQAPLQGVYPVSQPNEHALLTHTACAFATLVVHAWPHVMQFSASLVVSTQLPLQSLGAADGHPDAHEYTPPEPAHTAVPPVHALPQLPQLAAVVNWTHAPPQRL